VSIDIFYLPTKVNSLLAAQLPVFPEITHALKTQTAARQLLMYVLVMVGDDNVDDEVLIFYIYIFARFIFHVSFGPLNFNSLLFFPTHFFFSDLFTRHLSLPCYHIYCYILI
jgi:hypothetical protein